MASGPPSARPHFRPVDNGRRVGPRRYADAVPADPDPRAVRLAELVRGNAWMMRVLRTVRDAGIPDAWVGAGAVRDLVWGELFGGGFEADAVRDVDVVFFDPADLGRDNDERVEARLREAWAGVPWEAKNQAAVHTWYARRFGGGPVAPLTSIADAVGTWPETATAVAVRLGGDERIEICAPRGLGDLLGGVWRRNPRRVSAEVSRARLARQRPSERWPGVRVATDWVRWHDDYADPRSWLSRRRLARDHLNSGRGRSCD